MSIGGIQHEADLRRWLQSELRQPGLVPRSSGAGIALIKEGVPNDADFPAAPADGTLALDKATSTLYARVDSAWVVV